MDQHNKSNSITNKYSKEDLLDLRNNLLYEHDKNLCDIDTESDGIVIVKGYTGTKTQLSESDYEKDLMNLDKGYSNVNALYEDNLNNILVKDIDNSSKIEGLLNLKDLVIDDNHNYLSERSRIMNNQEKHESFENNDYKNESINNDQKSEEIGNGIEF